MSDDAPLVFDVESSRLERARTAAQVAFGSDSGLSLTGLERIQMLAGVGGPAPFAQHMRLRFDEVSRGAVLTSMDVPARLGPMFTVAPTSVLGGLADMSTGGALVSTVGPGEITLSVQLRIDVVGEIDPDTRLLTARSRSLQSDGEFAMAVSEIDDDHGRTIAHCVLRAATTRIRAGHGPAPADAVDSATDSSDTNDRRATLLPASLAAEFGIDEVLGEDAMATLRVVPPAVTSNSVGMVHGGAVAMYCALSGAATVRRHDDRAPAQTGHRRELGLEVWYFFPNRVGRRSELTGTAMHGTQRLLTIDGAIVDTHGHTTSRYRQLWGRY